MNAIGRCADRATRGDEMPDHASIYDHDAAQYDRLVSREDVDGALARTIADLIPQCVETVVELGAGTGRVTRLLAPRAARVLAFDAAAPMLAVARARLDAAGLGARVSLAVGEHHALPAPDGVADAVFAGWAIAHAVGWYPEGWRGRVDAALAEIARVSRPGARAVIIETLGTGTETPSPPAKLVPFYAHLEARGFARRVIRTDYRFADAAELAELIGFFFGPELATRYAGGRDVPECTGVWVREG
ncbi:MAG: class I SAM-dependent methyltransferase [Deltaproteobacteria bacterium HGW-Deltaproteobacteria-14]|nr:MAG: class I SAM-dependent methyltransferase [Deltaproteobacteria bacterium HGW-Deltaproteobacteria-14]